MCIVHLIPVETKGKTEYNRQRRSRLTIKSTGVRRHYETNFFPCWAVHQGNRLVSYFMLYVTIGVQRRAADKLSSKCCIFKRRWTS